jgi:hypothetical protein
MAASSLYSLRIGGKSSTSNLAFEIGDIGELTEFYFRKHVSELQNSAKSTYPFRYTGNRAMPDTKATASAVAFSCSKSFRKTD